MLVGANTELLLPVPQVRAQVPSPPSSYMAPTLRCWLHYWCPCHPVPSSSSSPSVSLASSSASRHSPLSWSLPWQVGMGVGGPGWGHTTLGVLQGGGLGVLCPLPLCCFPAGQLLVVAARRGAGGAWLVLPQEEPHHQLTSTPDR